MEPNKHHNLEHDTAPCDQPSQPYERHSCTLAALLVSAHKFVIDGEGHDY